MTVFRVLANERRVYLAGVMTPLGQSQRLDLNSLHWHQLSPCDPVACDWLVIIILASDWSFISPEVVTTGLVTGTRAVQEPELTSSFTRIISFRA